MNDLCYTTDHVGELEWERHGECYEPCYTSSVVTDIGTAINFTIYKHGRTWMVYDEIVDGHGNGDSGECGFQPEHKTLKSAKAYVAGMRYDFWLEGKKAIPK